MFWIQEVGKRNNSAYKLYYAEYQTDLDLLPTNTMLGIQTDCNASINDRCALGSECFVIENSSLYILTTNGWRVV